MELSALKTFFDTSPAIGLFRSPNFPYIVDFLYQTFKRDQNISLSHTDLQAEIIKYCEDVGADVLTGKPEEYLHKWAGDARWLDRKLGAMGEAEYQLSPATESVLNYLNHNLNNELGFIGTESRLKMIIGTLDSLVEQACDDPQVRRESLKKREEAILAEIDKLDHDDIGVQLSDGQIRERFLTAMALLQQLQGDFRAVEDEFKNITREVQAKQANILHSRGQVLGDALDAEDILRENDQGVSFYEFFHFILNPTQQEALQETIEQLKAISALHIHTKPMETLGRMVPLLVQEAQNIMRTNHRLTTTLRRLLDSRNVQQRQRVNEVLKEIQVLGMELAIEEKLPENIGLDVELRPILESPWKYNFWTAAEEFDVQQVSNFQANTDQQHQAFNVLAQMKSIKWDKLKGNIKDMTQARGSVTLGELIEDCPLESGAVEVLCYLQLASEQGHIVSNEAYEEIHVLNNDNDQGEFTLTVPLVRFIKK